jgi:hypothetical protein
MKPNFHFAAALFAACCVASGAFAAQTQNVSFAVVARVGDPTRTSEVRVEGKQTQSPLDQVFKVVKGDVHVELVPKALDEDGVLFYYRVSKKHGAKWVALSSGDLHARSGQKTYLLAGDEKYGHLVNLSIRLPARPGNGGSVGRPESRPALFEGEISL